MCTTGELRLEQKQIEAEINKERERRSARKQGKVAIHLSGGKLGEKSFCQDATVMVTLMRGGKCSKGEG